MCDNQNWTQFTIHLTIDLYNGIIVLAVLYSILFPKHGISFLHHHCTLGQPFHQAVCQHPKISFLSCHRQLRTQAKEWQILSSAQLGQNTAIFSREALLILCVYWREMWFPFTPSFSFHLSME